MPHFTAKVGHDFISWHVEAPDLEAAKAWLLGSRHCTSSSWQLVPHADVPVCQGCPAFELCSSSNWNEGNRVGGFVRDEHGNVDISNTSCVHTCKTCHRKTFSMFLGGSAHEVPEGCIRWDANRGSATACNDCSSWRRTLA